MYPPKMIPIDLYLLMGNIPKAWKRMFFVGIWSIHVVSMSRTELVWLIHLKITHSFCSSMKWRYERSLVKTSINKIYCIELTILYTSI